MEASALPMFEVDGMKLIKVISRDGRIVPVSKVFVRKPPRRADYLLRYRRDFPLAVIEAKAAYKSAADGLQQAKHNAEMLGLKFVYATNGHEISTILPGAKRRARVTLPDNA